MLTTYNLAYLKHILHIFLNMLKSKINCSVRYISQCAQLGRGSEQVVPRYHLTAFCRDIRWVELFVCVATLHNRSTDFRVVGTAHQHETRRQTSFRATNTELQCAANALRLLIQIHGIDMHSPPNAHDSTYMTPRLRIVPVAWGALSFARLISICSSGLPQVESVY